MPGTVSLTQCVVTLLVILSVTSTSLGALWDYTQGDHGPAHWGTTYTDCLGDRQSPVDLVTSKTHHRSPLRFTHHDKLPGKAEVINNGHTVKLTTHPATAEDIPIMEGGGLPVRYKFAQVHFHWGSDDTKGSEHKVNGKPYPMEMHFVHYKASHPNISAALKEGAGDSLAALGVFFEVGESPNPGLEKLLPAFSEVTLTGVKTTSESAGKAPLLPLTSLLHEADFTSFYRYEGSLTTPACQEIVQWTVLKKPVSVTKEQMEAFRKLQDGEGAPLVNNYRPIQTLGDREIVEVYTGDTENGAGLHGTHYLLPWICLPCFIGAVL